MEHISGNKNSLTDSLPREFAYGNLEAFSAREETLPTETQDMLNWVSQDSFEVKKSFR